MQITECVKQWIPVQLHSEPDASKDGQIRPHIRPHIRRPYPAGAGFGRIWKFGRISAAAGAGYDIRCNPNFKYLLLVWKAITRWCDWITNATVYCSFADNTIAYLTIKSDQDAREFRNISDNIITNFLLILTVKWFENWLIFGKVKAYRNGANIFGPPCGQYWLKANI